MIGEPGAHFLHGYPDQRSVASGQPIGFHVSTSLRSYGIEIARVGATRQVVHQVENLAGTEHPLSGDCSSHGCDWPVTLALRVPDAWESGHYEVLMRGAARDGSEIHGRLSFVVRSASPGRDARILLQRTTNTDNAYNNYGGTTLYHGPNGPGHRVSFARPFAGFEPYGWYLASIAGRFEEALGARTLGDVLAARCAEEGIGFTPHHHVAPGRRPGIWHLYDVSAAYTFRQRDDCVEIYDAFSVVSSCWRRWEMPFVQWAERAGYRFDYAVNDDLEHHPEMLEAYALVLSVGHDEYWSSPMRDHLEAFIASGGNVAFFSGNNLWWQVRGADDGRAMVCWKDALKDPLYRGGDRRLLSTLWCHHLVGRPENHLTGVSFARGGYHRFFDQYHDGPDGYVVHRPDHWLFAGTGLQHGDRFGVRDRIVGYECDGCAMTWRDGVPVPTGEEGTPSTFEILATGEAALSAADDSYALANEGIFGPAADARLPSSGAAVLGTYTCGGTVVTVGSTDWSSGLSGGDAAVTRITRNVLDRLGGRRGTG